MKTDNEVKPCQHLCFWKKEEQTHWQCRDCHLIISGAEMHILKSIVKAIDELRVDVNKLLMGD